MSDGPPESSLPPEKPVPPPLPRMFLARDPDVLVARVALGATFYLQDPVSWGRAGAGRALEAFFAAAPKGSLTWAAVSTRSGWSELGRGDLERLSRHVSFPELPKPRHGFRFRVGDDPEVPSVQFDYREIDPERDARAGILEVTLPQESPPETLLRLVRDITAAGPMWSAIGGVVGRWNERQKSAAFWQLFTWARRHLGLDVQDAEDAACRAAEGLPSTNWLTFVGHGLAEKKGIDLGALAASTTSAPIATEEGSYGRLWRAGELSRSDMNFFQVPHDYAAAARALEPLLDPAPMPMWSGFWEGAKTKTWQRRFLEPADWQA